MSYISRIGLLAVWAMLAWVGMASEAVAQALPNPYRAVDGWAQLPEGRQMGAVGGVTVEPGGEYIWAVVRCDAATVRWCRVSAVGCSSGRTGSMSTQTVTCG